MNIQHEQPEDVDIWFNNTFWPYYLALKKLHHGKPGVKHKCKVAIEKHFRGVKDKKAGMESLYRSTMILARYDLDDLAKGGKPDRWPHGSTYINSKYFERDVESYAEAKIKRDAKICSTQGCDKPCHGDKFQVCQDHLPDSWAADRRSHAIEKGFGIKEGESRADWIGRMRCIARSAVRGIG